MNSAIDIINMHKLQLIGGESNKNKTRINFICFQKKKKKTFNLYIS